MGYYCGVNKDKGILRDSLKIKSWGGDCCSYAVIDEVVTSSLKVSDWNRVFSDIHR
jgi:hypothetical protein